MKGSADRSVPGEGRATDLPEMTCRDLPNMAQLSTNRVLVTEWVDGGHLSALSPEDGLRMTRMAVEACTASLVLSTRS